MFSMRNYILSAGLALAVGMTPLAVVSLANPAMAASEIKIVVNKVPITNFDIKCRAAFLRLQRRPGNLNALAEQEMIDQALRMSEMQRLGIRIPDEAVSQAYARFASGNKMTVQQLDGIMTQSGITPAHFKAFIRSQMGWDQVIGARAGGKGAVTEQDMAHKMLQNGGNKPSATEYMLQQVIFVVPAAERGSMAKRKREAEAMRQRFSSCDKTREFAKGLVDVTVRDLGRKLAPELPQDWAEQIKATKVGGATVLRETERGIEFIGICSSREVSDDRVATLALKNEGSSGGEAGKKVMEELREKARIERR